MAKEFLANLKGVDAFGKTTDDVKIETRTDAFLTLVSAAKILSFTLMESINYRRIYIETSLLVDRIVSVDVMDMSGEAQRDISHSIRKMRLDSSGNEIRSSRSTQLKNETLTIRQVRTAYVNKGWSFTNPDSIEQCRREGWATKLKEQANEGVRDIYELVPYLRDEGNKHNYSHTIHELTFDREQHDYNYLRAKVTKEMRQRLAKRVLHLAFGLECSLLTTEFQHMYQRFLKVVSTYFNTINGQLLKSHQYRATHFERDVAEGSHSDTPQGVYFQHRASGVPGVFFNFEISHILVSIAHSITSTCPVIGGVLTVTSLFDGMLFATVRALKKHQCCEIIGRMDRGTECKDDGRA
ncbi:endoplasmic reticulum-derived transport vesicle ERV46 [Lentinula boryana]|uniref:Endoplasmic reticulum-derived transport vesicle ERV46 n=1 Tax=Lentinula boryana TaxID=40481 RepID=A0ABQ8PYZ9_9AGAR|nr:endoplasmic reticulum-derived transport vesicle ERV46 [Lentinula boryana]